MSMPFYVSPEQIIKDKADYARKGIARGRSVVVMQYDGGILFVAENPSRALHKISEIYDRIAFAAVGKYNEFENLRVAGVRLAMQLFPGVPQVGCFDTAFHRGQPFVNDTFAIPFRYYEKGVRRYGFHGLSYEYVTGELARIAPHLTAGRVVVAHLGNGASMCAIHRGRSVASSMGFSALDGLPMGTRCGQIDPGVLLYMLDQEKLDTAQIRQILYNESGLLGLSGGLSNDMRTLETADNAESHRAIDYFVFRVQRELGAMAAVMGGIDALVFCGGIGENSRVVRRRVCERLGWMGIEIDHGRNAEGATVISSEFSRTTVMIVPTHEELVIARAARAAVGAVMGETA